MQDLTVGELIQELERWPELADYKVKVGPYQLIKDEDGNIYSKIEGGFRSVWLKGEYRE